MHVFIFVCIVLFYMCNELHQVVVILAAVAVIVLAFAEVAVTGLVTIVKIVVLIWVAIVFYFSLSSSWNNRQ